MIELQPPAEHRVPQDAADMLEVLIIEAQLGRHDLQAFRLARAWNMIKSYDASIGIEPTTPQVIRWFVRASQQAQADWNFGMQAAELNGASNRKPFPKLLRPEILDVSPEIWQYVETYYQPA